MKSLWGVPHPDLAIVPRHRGLDGGTPRKGTGTRHWGTLQKGQETSESIVGWRWGTPFARGQTDICENSTFPFLWNAGGNYFLTLSTVPTITCNYLKNENVTKAKNGFVIKSYARSTREDKV